MRFDAPDDNDGELYLLSKTSGDIYQLAGLSPTPEPASWTMLIAGFAVIGRILRRRNAAQTTF